MSKAYSNFYSVFCTVSDRLNFFLHLETQFDRLMKKLRQLNLLETVETHQSIDIRHYQILSTRLYLILWIISIIFLTTYIGFSEKSTVITVKSPSMTDVKKLQSQNPDEFSCSCSRITISFETFTSLNFTLHQVK